MNKKREIPFHPQRAFFGYRLAELERARLEELLDMLGILGVSYGDISIEGESARLRLPFFGFSKIRKAAQKRGIDLRSVREYGLPAFLWRHRARVGVPLGIMIGFLLIFLSGSVIWDVRIDGEGRLSEDYVKGVLEDCGLSVGKFKSELDIDVIENRVLIISDDISWISVNVIGTVAKVEVRIIDFASDEEEPPAANLVAEEGGTIVGFEDIKGNISVDIGQNVGLGQLLIGGIIGNELSGFRYLCAEGRVFASVNHRLCTKIPRTYQKKSYTGREKCEKSLIFFKKEIKFFGNSGNLYPVYDKIDTVEYLQAGNGNKLPFGIRTVHYLEYEYIEQSRSAAELEKLANYKMNLLIYDLGGEVQSKRFSCFVDESGCVLTCHLTVVKNIARRQEIEID